MVDVPTAEVQEFEDLVERRRVGGLGRADRECALEIAGDEVGLEERLAGTHPVPVAAHGVDLAVVRHEPKGVRERPRREGVGGEPGVDDGDRTEAAVISQILVVQRELHRREHALVDHRSTRQRWEVQPGAGFVDLRCHPFGLLAERVDEAVEREPGDAVGAGRRVDGDEQLHHVRHARDGRPADVGVFVVDGDALVGGEGLDPFDRRAAEIGVHGQEARSRGVAVRPVRGGLGKVEVDGVAQQLIGELDQDSRAVTAVGLRPGRTSMFEVLQRQQPVGDDRMRTATVDVGDHGHTTRIDLGLRIVQTLLGRQRRKQHHYLHSNREPARC